MDKTIKKIFIHSPYIKKCNSEIFDKSVRLCANIDYYYENNSICESRVCFFEFEKEYEKFICTERSDAFVLGLLTSCMEEGYNICFEAPISKRLYFQLTNWYIPMISKYNSNYPIFDIMLEGPVSDIVIENDGGIGTGCSGGVDSFYTIKKYSREGINRLTHLFFSSSGTLDCDHSRIIKTFRRNMRLVKEISKECSLGMVACYNNLHEFYRFPYRGFSMFYTSTYVSTAFAVQKLIHIYYASSGDPITKFNIDITKTKGHDAQVFDVFTVAQLSTENLTVYSSGADCSRIEKEAYISDYSPANKYLTVCARDYQDIGDYKWNYRNCGMCPKCLRTMAQLYVLGQLNQFGNVFDVNRFEKNISRNIGKMMATNKVSYVSDLIRYSKKGVRVPFTSYIWYLFYYKPEIVLRHLFKNNKLLRYIYYSLKLDYKLNGYRSADYEQYVNNKKIEEKSGGKTTTNRELQKRFHKGVDRK